MADVYVAAAPGEEDKARGLADALKTLGFDAEAGAPKENDVKQLTDSAKAVLLIWSRAANSAPWFMALSMLAFDRKKLVSAEAESGATPGPFQTAPRIDLAVRDRTQFKARFQALIVELDKLAPTKGEEKAMPDALSKARAALLKPIVPPKGSQARKVGIFMAAVVALFAVGFGAGRVIQAVRSGDFSLAPPRAEASTTSAPVEAQTPARITMAELERQPWREVVARIDADAGASIQDGARRGDALDQTLACLAHLGGAEGFLPSPVSAREQCDAAAAQNNAAGLYFSWVLHREAPHAELGEAEARARLIRAAELGWTPALIDYGQLLGPGQQAEAGRLFLAAAEKNDPRGQFAYARWLRDSPAGPRDPAAAIPYLDRAARAGQLDAAHMLATLYRDGIGAERNATRARALYEQAARGGHSAAMFNLADMLRTGSEQDRARAVALYRDLACMSDERQIQPMAAARLRALQESAACR
jgi:hypothetical protein